MRQKIMEIVERIPTVEEYQYLIASVGFKQRDPEAISLALENSYYAVCAFVGDELIGIGRIIGDGGLHYYLTDVIVHMDYQGKGYGTRIVKQLMTYFDRIHFRNTVIGVMPTRGLRKFYERFGFKAQRAHSPAMILWINQ